MPTFSLEETRNRKLYYVKHSQTYSVALRSLCINAYAHYTIIFMQIKIQKKYVAGEYYQKGSIIC